jgi:hypothetical protein
MGINRRRDDIHVYIQRTARDQAALADALATVEEFNSRLAAGRTPWFWPTIGAALITKHHWLVIACDSCDTITEIDLIMKPRDPEAPIRIADEWRRYFGESRIAALLTSADVLRPETTYQRSMGHLPLRAKLAPLRAKLNNVEDGRPCFRCNCPDFVRLPGHTHSTTCARETCGHSITSHEL